MWRRECSALILGPCGSENSLFVGLIWDLIRQAEFFEWSDPAKAAVQAEDDEGPSPAEADSLIKPMTL